MSANNVDREQKTNEIHIALNPNVTQPSGVFEPNTLRLNAAFDLLITFLLEGMCKENNVSNSQTQSVCSDGSKPVSIQNACNKGISAIDPNRRHLTRSRKICSLTEGPSLCNRGKIAKPLRRMRRKVPT